MRTLILLIALSFSSLCFAQTLPNITPPRGFDEGTEVKLSTAQMKDILPYATNSRNEASDLLDTTVRFESKSAVTKLKTGIRHIVEQSLPKKSELLMRFVLNRALLLSDELEKHDPVDQDTELRLLRSSVEFSIRYAADDETFLKETRSLPYAKFGLEYAQFLMTLDQSILNLAAQYNVAVTALGLLQWDLYRDEEHNKYAPAIFKISALVDGRLVPENVIENELDTLDNLRAVKETYRKALKAIGLDQSANENQSNESPGNTNSKPQTLPTSEESGPQFESSYVSIGATSALSGPPSIKYLIELKTVGVAGEVAETRFLAADVVLGGAQRGDSSFSIDSAEVEITGVTAEQWNWPEGFLPEDDFMRVGFGQISYDRELSMGLKHLVSVHALRFELRGDVSDKTARAFGKLLVNAIGASYVDTVGLDEAGLRDYNPPNNVLTRSNVLKRFQGFNLGQVSGEAGVSTNLGPIRPELRVGANVLINMHSDVGEFAQNEAFAQFGLGLGEHVELVAQAKYRFVRIGGDANADWRTGNWPTVYQQLQGTNLRLSLKLKK